VDAEDDKGLTAFQIASSKGHDEIAQLLLDYRACTGSSIM
jgi:ankyrin repeat protein